MYTLEGILHYTPVESNSSSAVARTLVVELPQDDSSSYYQWFLHKKYGSWLKLQPPMWGLHVTVIKHTELIADLSDWGLYEGNKILVNLDNLHLERHWGFWSLSVYSEDLVCIRSFYGLPVDYRFHMTLGRQFEWQPNVIIPEVVHDIDYYSDNLLYQKPIPEPYVLAGTSIYE